MMRDKDSKGDGMNGLDGVSDRGEREMRQWMLQDDGDV